MQNLSVIFAHARCHLSCQERLWHSVAFSSKRKSVSSKTKPLCQGLPCQGSWRASARLRGWTKDAFRVSGITQVLLCTTSPSSSLRSMPPPLVGEALAFRDVFQQTQISFIENDTSLPRALLPGELARQRLRGQARQNETRKRSDTMSLTNRVCIAVRFAFCQHPCPLRLLRRHLSQSERLWHSVTFSSKRKSVSSKTTPLCQGLPCQGSWRRRRLRGWIKDAFRVSGITQVLLCTTSPTSSLRSMPPPLVGEALAFCDVFQQTQISFIENETSLPRAPLLGELAPQASERLDKGRL